MKAIIIEDEPLSAMYLTSLLQNWCTDIVVASAVKSVAAAAEAIQIHSPDIIFLDIELGGESGFDLLDQLNDNYPKIIITTALADHALQLIQPSGIPYLQKPVDKDDLLSAMQKIRNISKEDFQQHISLLRDYHITHLYPSAIYAEDADDTGAVILLADVILIEAAGEHVCLHVNTGKKIIARNITYRLFQHIIDRSVFYRINKFQFINVKWIENKDEKNTMLIMKGGLSFSLPPNQVKDFMAIYQADLQQQE